MTGADALLRSTIEKYFGTEGADTDAVLDSLTTIRIDGGQWLFRQGDAGDSLFFLVRGRLQVWLDAGKDSPEEGARLLGEVLPGESVGEVSMLTGASRSAAVRAIRDSKLVRVGRAEFEALAKRHPTMVMRLAGRIAATLRDRTSRSGAAASAFQTIAVVALSAGPRVDGFCRCLESGLGGFGATRFVAPHTLAAQGAPDADGDAVSEALRHWLHEQEALYRFLVYRADAAATPWSVYAMQQSDLVVFVADATDAAAPSTGESELLAAGSMSNARRMLVLLQGPPASTIRGTKAWLEPRRIDFHLHAREGLPDEVDRVARVIAGRAVGLVLAAGAARGIAHLGIHRAMREVGIPIDWVGGTSIGAIVAGCIAMGLDPDAATGMVGKAFATTNPFGDFTIPMFSLLRGRRLDRLLAEHLKGRIEDLPVPFFAVSCNLDSGAPNIHESGSLADALRASAAMPGVMPPAIVDHRLAIDGAVLNSMPVDVMETKPVGAIVAVDLSSQKSYDVPYSKMPSPWAVLGGRLFPFLFRRYRVPTLMTLLLKATEVGTIVRVREHGARADLLLAPPVREFGVMDVGAFDRIVEAGYRYGLETLSAWKREREGGQGPEK